MSSLLVQVTVVPTGTVSVCGPKTKLSIFTVAEGWSFALALSDPVNSISIAITTGIAKPASHTFLFVVVIILFLDSGHREFDFLAPPRLGSIFAALAKS